MSVEKAKQFLKEYRNNKEAVKIIVPADIAGYQTPRYPTSEESGDAAEKAGGLKMNHQRSARDASVKEICFHWTFTREITTRAASMIPQSRTKSFPVRFGFFRGNGSRKRTAITAMVPASMAFLLAG